MEKANLFVGNVIRCKEQNRVPVIAEIKVYSPSRGELLRGRDPLEIARAYVNNGAACLSVVTGKWYKGDLGLLERIASRVDYPILRKDFITNEKQVDRTKDAGAQAVLLTGKLLSKGNLLELANYALTVGLTPFVEVGGKTEIDELEIPKGAILAINNKDISVKEIDQGTPAKSLDLIQDLQHHKAALYVSASGIDRRETLNKLLQSGFDAVLIGTALLECNDIAEGMRMFTGKQ